MGILFYEGVRELGQVSIFHSKAARGEALKGGFAVSVIMHYGIMRLAHNE